MALYTIPQRIKHRRGTYTELFARNEVLLEGEECFETHDSAGVEHNPWKCKVGDGETPWNDLEYEATGSGTTDIAAEIHAATSKTTPVDADELGLVDSAASNALAKLTWANLKAGIWSAWGALINGGTSKTTPVDGDALGIMDSAASNATKKLTWANLKATLKTYTDTLYASKTVSATSRVLGRKTSGSGDVEEVTLSELLDFIGSAAQGDVLYRGASAWARLAAGTSGQLLKTQGAGANPTWATVAGVTGGLSYVNGATTGSSVQVLTVTGLNLTADGMYLVYLAIKNGTGGSLNYSLYYNSDTTAANYTRQAFNPNNATLGAARAADAILFTTSATGGVGEAAFATIFIGNDVDGKARADCRCNSDSPTLIRMYTAMHVPTTAYNVTSLTISANSASGIASGSYVRVFKVTP